MKIGLFDSGIGGLNVLNELLKKYPNNKYYYYGDTLNIPYGNKDKETLLKLATDIIHFFENIEVDMIIIACGTISANCFFELSQITTIPLYDIITPTLDYLKEKENSKIAVFGTLRTIESHIFKNNLLNVREIKTEEFVPMIEENRVDLNIIEKYLTLIEDVDILVLGCTHYPLLKEYFKNNLAKKIEIVDMGECLAKKIKLENQGTFELNLYFTKIDDNLKTNIKKIIPKDFKLNLIKK